MLKNAQKGHCRPHVSKGFASLSSLAVTRTKFKPLNVNKEELDKILHMMVRQVTGVTLQFLGQPYDQNHAVLV